MGGRIFVIGIDGGDFSLLRPWIEAGKLPSLAHIYNQGSRGNLRSTIPPITGAAWSSFLTGTNPGKHGAFNWFKRVEGEYRARPVTSRDLKEPTLWQIVSKMGKVTGSLGVPVTYPPYEVNGFLIPGLLTPGNADNKSYPPELIKKIYDIAPGFQFSPREWTRGYEQRDWVDNLKKAIKARTRIADFLMDEYDWDLVMVHFMETDQVQHFMWHLYEEDEYHNPILEIYQSLDEAIGKLQNKLTPEDTLLIMSDHGFGPLRFNFHIDTWLLKEGYLRLRRNPTTFIKRLLFQFGLTKEGLYPLGEYLYPLLRHSGKVETVLDLVGHPWLERLFLSSQNVDWSRSVAYSHSEIGHIYLNRKGREPYGILDEAEAEKITEELMEKLNNMKNPLTGKKIAGEIMRGRDIYQGSYVKEAPDIVFIPEDMELLGKGAYEFLSHRVVSKAKGQTGHHRMDGIMMATGPQIEEGKDIKGAHIKDITPTILYLLRLPLLKHMDGRVLSDMIKEDYLSKYPPSYKDKYELGLSGEDDKISDTDDLTSEEEEMKERLKGLGYLS